MLTRVWPNDGPSLGRRMHCAGEIHHLFHDMIVEEELALAQRH